MTVKNNNGWISVDERFPDMEISAIRQKMSRYVIIFSKEAEEAGENPYLLGFYSYDSKAWCANLSSPFIYQFKASHWHALPEPPNELCVGEK